ncbi:phage tail protein [Pseudomonas sp. B21-048]|uniref:phage tail protein n=1 Tax=Pseudomonas sp. B21-048 TaxID=2895490 RepID=UPI002160851E|nr:phage tail protein [Pseudomonas sp. B21-048]UVK96447.1 phage tail protein [Pseudomonas sp. B21-048]
MLAFTWVPTYDATKTITPTVKVIKFGDGYEQRQGTGINRQPRKLALTFKRPKAEIEAIDAFLKARGAIEAFTYTHSGQSIGVFVCREWTRTNIAKGIDGLSVTFEEVYE